MLELDEGVYQKSINDIIILTEKQKD